MASAHRFTQADVSAALSRLFALPPEHEGIVKFSGALQKAVNETPELRKGGLDGSGFTTLAISNAPGDLLAAVDVGHREKLQRMQYDRANITSADAAALAAAYGARAGMMTEAAAGKSGQRFGELPDGERMTPAMLAAQSLALKTPGVEWAAHNRELLRISRSDRDVSSGQDEGNDLPNPETGGLWREGCCCLLALRDRDGQGRERSCPCGCEGDECLAACRC
jgi:hypothetical protein